MALAGARGDTEREMIAVLKHRLAREEIDAANASVLATLNGYDKSAVPPTCPAGMPLNGKRCEAVPAAGGECRFPARREGELCVADPSYPPSAKLSVADALMLAQRGDLISKQYAALLKDKYAAEVFEGARLDTINGWVARKTEGRIDKILDQLDPSSAAVLLNAVYFKAKWASVFSKSATRDGTFNLTAAEQVSVPTMHKIGAYALVARQGYRAIRLPYDVDALGMIVVLPDTIDGLAGVAARLGADEPAQLFAALRAPGARSQVDLALPRFKVAFKAGLGSLFQQAGMQLAFDPRRADFSGMTGRPLSEARLSIGAILHRAVIDVMEDGTEAAAATAVSMVATSAPARQPDKFHVDRPFLFYIVDDATGAILFQGRVSDPR
jgi:serpin B